MDGWVKKTKELRSGDKDESCVSKRLRMSRLQEEEGVVQDLRLSILLKMNLLNIIQLPIVRKT